MKKTFFVGTYTGPILFGTLDQMVEDAFDDQCTGANPRYPLLKEIKAMYLKAYYGEKA